MPSFSKLLAWSALMAIAIGVAVKDSNHMNDLEGRDIRITITTDGDASNSDCENLACWKHCLADDAIGGACEGSQGCQCAYSVPKFQIQEDGSRLRLAHTECDLKTCNDVCYQKGGYAGGVCTADGSCSCKHAEEVEPRESSSFHAAFCEERMWPHPSVCDANCRTYNDCANCWFYERCCKPNFICECGSTGNICT